MVSKLGVVGAGAWGSALAKALSNKHKVFLYTHRKNLAIDAGDVKITNDLADLSDLSHILLVVPAQKTRGICEELKGHISEKCKIIICSKGIEVTSGKLMSDVAEEFFPRKNIFILSGPNYAHEVAEGLPAASSIASHSLEEANQIKKELTFHNLELVPTDEITLVQIFGALKNVLAILCGFSIGLDLGENARAVLLTKGIAEITKLAHTYGKTREFIIQPGCMGDVFLTCTSLTSRNTKFGLDLAKKYDKKNRSVELNGNTIEGVYTVKALKNLDLTNYNLLRFAVKIITNSESDTLSSYKNIFEKLLVG